MALRHLQHTTLGLQSRLTTAAEPASVSGQEQEVDSFWAKPYRQKLQALPPPSRFGTMWLTFQTPQGNLADDMQFDRPRESMLSVVREELLYFFQQVMTPYVCFMTLEPSLTSGVSCADLASSFRS